MTGDDMIDQYFGTKQLYEVVLRAKVPMRFGSRYIEAGEPVLYFQNINLANLPRVIWEDRAEVQFTLSEGVMSSIGMSILLSAEVLESIPNEPLLISKRDGPLFPSNNRIILTHKPTSLENKKIFIFQYARNVAQKKIYGKFIHDIPSLVYDEAPCIELYQDKNLSILADNTKEYIVDYYYEYEDKALIYLIQKQRFNGLFTLEGKFYSKDENEGLNYTNLIYMPKVRVVSDINLRLGERADPTVSVFSIIGLPENAGNNRQSLILQITRLNSDIDGDI